METPRTTVPEEFVTIAFYRKSGRNLLYWVAETGKIPRVGFRPKHFPTDWHWEIDTCDKLTQELKECIRRIREEKPPTIYEDLNEILLFLDWLNDHKEALLRKTSKLSAKTF